MRTVDKRYLEDPVFAQLVDTMYQAIFRFELTPTEIREAAMLAQIKYEMDNPRRTVFSPELQSEIAFRTGKKP